MVSRQDSVAECWVSGSCMAQKRSDEMLFTGLAKMERLQMKPTPPHPRFRSEFSFRRLSEKPKPTKSGWILFSWWSWYGQSQCSEIAMISDPSWISWLRYGKAFMIPLQFHEVMETQCVRLALKIGCGQGWGDTSEWLVTFEICWRILSISSFRFLISCPSLACNEGVERQTDASLVMQYLL